jgi:hypothetical protein
MPKALSEEAVAKMLWDAQRLARDPKFMRAMDKLAGTVEEGGSITIEAGGQSVVIDHEAAQRIHANAVAAGAVKP